MGKAGVISCTMTKCESQLSSEGGWVSSDAAQPCLKLCYTKINMWQHLGILCTDLTFILRCWSRRFCMNAEQREPQSVLLMLRFAIATLLTCVTDTVSSCREGWWQADTPTASLELIPDVFMLNVSIKMYRVQKGLEDISPGGHLLWIVWNLNEIRKQGITNVMTGQGERVDSINVITHTHFWLLPNTLFKGLFNTSCGHALPLSGFIRCHISLVH